MDRKLRQFEVGVFNKTVRDQIAAGETVRGLDKEWADVHWIAMRASSKDRAQRQAEAKFPPENGYVIIDVIEEKEDRWGG